MTRRKFIVKRGARVQVGLPEDTATAATAAPGDGPPAAAGAALGSDADPNLYVRRRQVSVEIYDLGTRLNPEAAGGPGYEPVAALTRAEVYDGGATHDWPHYYDPMLAGLLAGDPFGETELDEGGTAPNCRPLDFASEYKLLDVVAGEDFVSGQTGKRPSVENMVAKAVTGAALTTAGQAEKWEEFDYSLGDAGRLRKVKDKRFRIVSFGPMQSLWPWEAQLFKVTREASPDAAAAALPAGRAYKVYLAPRVLSVEIGATHHFTNGLGDPDFFAVSARLYSQMPCIDPRGKLFTNLREDDLTGSPNGEYAASLFDNLRNFYEGDPAHAPACESEARMNYFLYREFCSHLDSHTQTTAALADPKPDGVAWPSSDLTDGGVEILDVGYAHAHAQPLLAGVVVLPSGDRYYVWLAPSAPALIPPTVPDPTWLYSWEVYGQLELREHSLHAYALHVGEFPYESFTNGLVENIAGAWQDGLDLEAQP